MLQETKKLDQLTTTRFIAALSVVFFHSARNLDIFKFLPMLTAGPAAVSYFYVLSGLVMALVYYRPGKPFIFSKYWLARFSRIYPVYIFSFILTCLYYIEILSKIKPDKVLANIFLYQAWFPRYAQTFNIAAWSLSVETFFYMLFPFLIIFLARQPVKRVIWISLVFWGVSQVIHSTLMIGFMPEKKYLLAYFPIFHLNAFLLGVAGGIWYVVNSEQKINQFKNQILFWGSLVFILLILSLRGFLPSFPQSFSLDEGLLAPFFLIIVLTLAMDATYLSHGLRHPWLVLLGESSYALYILHVPFRWLFERYLELTESALANSVMVIIYVPASIILCILVYKYIERPARDWLRAYPLALLFMMVDISLIFIMVKFSFLIRVGNEIDGYIRTQNLTLRVGIILFFVFMIVFQFYTNHSWRSLSLAILAGGVSLTMFIYFAWISGWVESFPRSILLLISILVFVSIYLSRPLIQYINARLISRSKLI